MTLELVILIGLQASGKSSFHRARFADTHDLVSKDRLRNNRRPGRRQRQLIETALAAGRSVVVDNTNPTVTDRLELVALARAAGARVTAYSFGAVLSECLERNRHRLGKARVPDVALRATLARYQAPTMSEGFDRLLRVRLLGDGEFEVTDWQETSSDASP